MNKKILLIAAVLPTLLLAWCWKPSTEEVWTQEATKQPYFVEVSTVKELNEWFNLKKTGKISGSQDIVVSAEIWWRVSSFSAEIWDEIKKWNRVVSLSDSSWAYSFAAQRASAGLAQSRINYEQTMLSLNKAITDTNLAIQQAENQANNAKLGILDSWAQQQLNQLTSQLDKANIDLQTKITSDEQTIQNSIASTRNLLATVKILYEDVINETDELLSVSYENQNSNRNFRRYISAENTAAKFTAENTLRFVLQNRDIIRNYQPVLTAENLSSELRTLEWYVNQLLPLLDQTDLVLSYTDTGADFSQAQLSWYKSAINALQSQTQGQSASLIQQANNIDSFLKTYKQSQESLQKSITSLEQQIAATKANLSSASINSWIGLESAQNSYQNTVKNKAATEQALLNGITQAQIAYNETQNNLGKLTVETPIDWVIGDILVDIGQEVSPGTPLFTIASNDEQEIEIALTSDEVERLTEGQKVTVQNKTDEHQGTLVSIANSSVKSLTYKAIVRLDEKADLLWWVATVYIPLSTDTLLLPLRTIKIINGKQGSINLWDGKDIQIELIELWKVRWKSVEVLSEIDPTTKIIISDVSNYDKLKQILKVK